MGQSAEVAAVKLANKLVEELRSGADFDKIVSEYSNGIYAGNGGAWGTVTLGTLVKPYDMLEGMAGKMRPAVYPILSKPTGMCS
jgi:hypothetical protein